MKAYLAGPIDNCTIEECTAWRRDLAERLRPLGITCLDPTHNMSAKIGNPGKIVRGDKMSILEARIVIAYCPFPSVGTSMEILFAYERARRVYVVSAQNALSPWITYHATRIFRDFDQLVEWLGMGGVADAIR